MEKKLTKEDLKKLGFIKVKSKLLKPNTYKYVGSYVEVHIPTNSTIKDLLSLIYYTGKTVGHNIGFKAGQEKKIEEIKQILNIYDKE